MTNTETTTGPSTYLNSRQAMDTRNASAQAKRPGSSWTFVVTIGNRAVASVGGFATHGAAVAAMYAARPNDFTSVIRIDADSTAWDVYASTPARPGYGKGRTGPVIGTAFVTLTDLKPQTADKTKALGLLMTTSWKVTLKTGSSTWSTIEVEDTDHVAAIAHARRLLGNHPFVSIV